jgi:hypothetical protein
MLPTFVTFFIPVAVICLRSSWLPDKYWLSQTTFEGVWIWKEGD